MQPAPSSKSADTRRSKAADSAAFNAQETRTSGSILQRLDELELMAEAQGEAQGQTTSELAPEKAPPADRDAAVQSL